MAVGRREGSLSTAQERKKGNEVEEKEGEQGM
jgi:hypothetical protein